MFFRTSTATGAPLEAGRAVFRVGQAPDLHLFQGALSHYLILVSVQRWFWAAPTFQAQVLPHLWSSPNGILNFQFGPHLNLKPDQPVKSHPQARQPLRKPHSPTLLMDMFLGKSLWRCHLKLQERTSKRKWVTESYANFTI